MASVSVGTAKVRQPATVTVSGASASTAYLLRIVHPGGATETHKVTTDGSGNATQTYVPQEPGTVTVNLDPVATVTGAAATTTATHTSG